MPRSPTPSPGIGRPLAELRAVVDDLTERVGRIDAKVDALGEIPRGIAALKLELAVIRRLLEDKGSAQPAQMGSRIGPRDGGAVAERRHTVEGERDHLRATLDRIYETVAPGRAPELTAAPKSAPDMAAGSASWCGMDGTLCPEHPWFTKAQDDGSRFCSYGTCGWVSTGLREVP